MFSADLEDQYLQRELCRQGPRIWLYAHHLAFPPIHPRPGLELCILGVPPRWCVPESTAENSLQGRMPGLL